MSIAETASKLLARYGEAVAMTMPPSTPAFNPVTGAAQTPSASTTVIGFGYPSAYRKGEIDGVTIKAGDIRLILEKIVSQPAAGYTIAVDGTTYRIQDVQKIRKTGADVIYICQLRAN
jgi:hypothetical protein